MIALAAVGTVYQSAAAALPIKRNAPNIEMPSSSPSSSMYARAIRMITTAGGMLLKGIGVSSNAALSRRTAIPMTLLHKTKTVANADEQLFQDI